ncbi:hypothetical protein ACIQW5_21030 [Methylorubrum thiocyanatum]|uniref:hypothetical protein n=1 Tax=Methylorubrum thiocyanatum TaxID=47958 RepID=UPI003839ED8B
MRPWPGPRCGALALALAPALCGEAAAELAPRSGRYGSMAVVVRDGRVSGVFAEGRGGVEGMPSFSCIFLLRGPLAGARATVETWSQGEAERIAGTLVFTAEGAELTLVEDHGGCPMATGSMVGQPFTLTRETPGAEVDPEGWRDVGLVTARRASLRPEPGPAPRRGPYLVASDPVAVLDRREGWVRVLYQGGEAAVTGWLPAAELAVAAP